MSRIPNCTRPHKPRVGVCRYCGCTEDDCSECVELTGEPCSWVPGQQFTLCSACETPKARQERMVLRKQLAEMENPNE